MKELARLKQADLLNKLAHKLGSIKLDRQITLMEVCGTHTMAIHRAGINNILPFRMRLLSGPGCPVCVTPSSYLSTAISMAKQHRIIPTTFGDMMRVPSAAGTLYDLRNNGYAVEIVYSPSGVLELAATNPRKQYVFLAIGFETTSPAVAATLIEARRRNLKNVSILSSHKLVIPALEILIDDPELNVDGFILPGHVSAIIGSLPYRFISEKHKRACVITGFETADIVQSILMLIDQISRNNFNVEIQYKRVVQPEGNLKAMAIMNEVFDVCDSIWRGFGNIPNSGLGLKRGFAEFDAIARFPVDIDDEPEISGCRCGDILRGHIIPSECALFGNSCTPENPIGPCMVSSEGTCAAYYLDLKRTRAEKR